MLNENLISLETLLRERLAFFRQVARGACASTLREDPAFHLILLYMLLAPGPCASTLREPFFGVRAKLPRHKLRQVLARVACASLAF